MGPLLSSPWQRAQLCKRTWYARTSITRRIDSWIVWLEIAAAASGDMSVCSVGVQGKRLSSGGASALMLLLWAPREGGAGQGRPQWTGARRQRRAWAEAEARVQVQDAAAHLALFKCIVGLCDRLARHARLCVWVCVRV